LRKKIDLGQAEKLYRQMRSRAEIIELKTIPPRCRDPKDHRVLATAIDGQANAIVTGDDDLRADDELRNAMIGYGVQLWGVQSLLDVLEVGKITKCSFNHRHHTPDKTSSGRARTWLFKRLENPRIVFPPISR